MIQQEPIKRAYCTSREAAQLLGVSLRTAQLWVESGLLEAWKTDGGHRRISRASVERLLTGSVGRDASGAFVSESASNAAATLQRSALSILVAEDEPALRRIYELTMSRWPMAPIVTTASDGYEALIRLGDSKPDLLITDLRMPGIDGFRMIRSIATLPELAHMTTVVVSGLDPGEIAAQGGVPPGIPILPKPIPFDQLREIAERIDTRRKGQKSKGANS